MRPWGKRRSWVGAGALAVALAAAGLAWGGPPEASKGGSLAGKLLVARPQMADPRFSEAVVYMVKHDASGAVGLIVNRPFEEVTIASLLERLGQDARGVRGSLRMRYGGPVGPGSLLVLHTSDYRSEETKVIAGGIALTSSPEILRAIAAGTGPRRALLLLSYSGWGPGQLEQEIRAGAWVTAPADPRLVFDDADGTKWKRAMAAQESDL